MSFNKPRYPLILRSYRVRGGCDVIKTDSRSLETLISVMSFQLHGERRCVISWDANCATELESERQRNRHRDRDRGRGRGRLRVLGPRSVTLTAVFLLFGRSTGAKSSREGHAPASSDGFYEMFTWILLQCHYPIGSAKDQFRLKSWNSFFNPLRYPHRNTVKSVYHACKLQSQTSSKKPKVICKLFMSTS